MENKAFLTIDSGGSKTKLSLYDLVGGLIKDCTLKGYGAIYDSKLPIGELVDRLIDFTSESIVKAVVCNLGGKNKNQLLTSIKTAFPKSKIKILREAEGVVGVRLCKKFNAQVTLMAGTGSICIAPVGKKVVISGGWGANISDKGSGYQLGLNAIRLALEELDSTDELSLLTKTITGKSEAPKIMTAKQHCDYRDGVRNALLPLDRANVASYAKKVYECAVKGDKKSLQLYQKVGIDLANNISLAVKKTGKLLKSAVVTGGMVNAKEFWQTAFEQKLNKEFGDIKVHYVANGIEIAICDIAKELVKGE